MRPSVALHQTSALPNALLAATLLAMALLAPGVAHAFTITDGDQSLRIGGWIQPTAELRISEDGQVDQRLRLQRARLDLQGTMHDERVRARVMAEFGAPGARVLDAFVDFEAHPMARILVGRAILPHQNQWGPNPATLLFNQRNLTSEHFAVPGGRDVQLQLHGQSSRLHYGVALASGRFDGSYAEAFSHAVLGRVLVAVSGEVHDDELPTERIEGVNAMVGAGGFAAFDSTWRDWSRGDGGEGLPGDVQSGFGELRLRADGLIVVVDGGVQHVSSLAVAGFEPTTGASVQGMVGYLLPFAPLVVGARYGEARLDLDESSNAVRKSAWGASLTWMHLDSRWYTRLEFNGLREAVRVDDVLFGDAETETVIGLTHLFRF